MTNLIIGTRGFIGQNLMRNLVELNVDFEIFDLEQTQQKSELDFAPLISFLNNAHRYDNIIDCVGVKKLTYFNDIIRQNEKKEFRYHHCILHVGFVVS